MKYLAPIALLLAAQASGYGAERDANADALAQDEAAVAVHIKALNDPSNDVRAAAAKALREIVAKYGNGTSNIRDPEGGKVYWTEKINQVKPGMRQAEVLKILPVLPNSWRWSGSNPQTRDRVHWVNDHWQVVVTYPTQPGQPDEVLERPKLVQKERMVKVPLPAGYTGPWTLWFVNGQKAEDSQYREGKYDGVHSTYYENGQKRFEGHYKNGRSDGPFGFWYPDGQKRTEGQWRNGARDGTVTQWHPNGVKESELNYGNGRLEGLQTHWYPNGNLSSVETLKDGKRDGPHIECYSNGQFRFLSHYKNGVRDGVATTWNEQGVVQSVEQYRDGQPVE
jgi:antitoxin component YwqK of YwqJK toxin-antitoxin module